MTEAEYAARHGFAVAKVGNRYLVTNTADGWKSSVGTTKPGAEAYLWLVNLWLDFKGVPS